MTGPLAHDVVLNHTFELLISTTMLFDKFEMSILLISGITNKCKCK